MSKIKSLSMLVLASYPWLWIYKSPIPILNIGDLLFFVLIAFFFINGGRFGLMNYTKEFKIFWMWAAVSMIIANMNSFKITYLIPGGTPFFIFAIIMGFVIQIFSPKIFTKYLRTFFLFTAVIWYLQFFQHILTGSHYSALIPFLQLTDDTDMGILMSVQNQDDQPSSLFREPAQYAQFLGVFLPIELFTGGNERKLYTPFSLMAIIILALLKSGNGLLILAIILLFKLPSYIRNATAYKKILTITILLPIMIFATFRLIATEGGQETIGRISELSIDPTGRTSTSGYMRVIRGFQIFDGLPTLNKFVGANDASILSYSANTDAVIVGEGIFDLYFNGIQNILIYRGIIGLFLFLILLYSLHRDNNSVSRVFIIVFLLISLVANTYLTHLMICCLAIPSYYKIQNRKFV